MLIGAIFIIGWLVIMTAIGFAMTTIKETKQSRQEQNRP